jgi:hypothetical protein
VEFARQLIKWLIVPSAIVIVQIALDAQHAFSSAAVMWGFIYASLAVLLVWRTRLRQMLSQVDLPAYTDGEILPPEDRRFACWASGCSLAFPLIVQLVILACMAAEVPVVLTHKGTFWTLFAIIAIGYPSLEFLFYLLLLKHFSPSVRMGRHKSGIV